MQHLLEKGAVRPALPQQRHQVGKGEIGQLPLGKLLGPDFSGNALVPVQRLVELLPQMLQGVLLQETALCNFAAAQRVQLLEKILPKRAEMVLEIL